MMTKSVTACDRPSAVAPQQWGISLIEAMVATLLLSVLFLGLAFVLSRALVGQRYMTTQNLALLEIREILQTTAGGADQFCKNPRGLEWLDGSIALETADCLPPTPITVTVDGLPEILVTPPAPINVKTSENGSTEWFGGVIELSSD